MTMNRYISENLLTELTDSIVRQIHFSVSGSCFDLICRPIRSVYVSYVQYKFFLAQVMRYQIYLCEEHQMQEEETVRIKVFNLI